MRDYRDNNTRLYTPILQQIIILVAVIIAVPVVMWTITSFIRGYIAPPRVPTFPMTMAPPSDSTTASTNPVPAASPSQQAQSPASSSPQVTADASLTTAPAPPTPICRQACHRPLPRLRPGPERRRPSRLRQCQLRRLPLVGRPPQPRIPLTKVTRPPRRRRPLSPLRGPIRQTTPLRHRRPTAKPRRARPTAAPTICLPDPIAGRIPLPRHRPTVFAMVAMTAVPLPRARPAIAPDIVVAPSTQRASSSPYDPGIPR